MPTLVLPRRFQEAPYSGDYYKIMGLEKGRAPTSEDIKKAYHIQSLQFHPDQISRSSVRPPLSGDEATECFQALAEIKSILLSTCSEAIDFGKVDRPDRREREVIGSADDLEAGEQLKACMLAYLRSERFCEYPPGIGPSVRGYWSYVVGGQNNVEIGTSKYSGMTAIATYEYHVERGDKWDDPVTVWNKSTRPFKKVTDPREINTVLANMASDIPKDRRDDCARTYGSHVRNKYLLEPVVPALNQAKAVQGDIKAGGAAEEDSMSRNQESRSGRSRRRDISPSSSEAQNKDAYKDALIAYMYRAKSDLGLRSGDWYTVIDDIDIGIGGDTKLLSLSSRAYSISIDRRGELSFWDKHTKKIVSDPRKNSQILQDFVEKMKEFLVLDTPLSQPYPNQTKVVRGDLKLGGAAAEEGSSRSRVQESRSSFAIISQYLVEGVNSMLGLDTPPADFSSRSLSKPRAYAEPASPKSPINVARGGASARQAYASDQKEARPTQVVARSIVVEQVNAASVSGFDVPEPGVGQKSHLNCPAPILAAFKETLTGADGRNILGGVVLNNPNGGSNVTLPLDISDLTPLHLQLLARNEVANTTGVMKTELYQGLLNADQIARIRCLVKATNTSTVTRVHTIGGYPEGVSRPSSGTPNNKTVVIDQAGLQWQGDYRNTGGLFFYPHPPSDPRLPAGYAAWQNEMYQAMYGQYRPVASSANFMEVTWDTKNSEKNVRGRIDLDGVEMAISAEFCQAIAAAALQTRGSEQLVNFKFLKAGMGCFAEGIARASTRELARLEVTRLKGIEQALIKLSQLDPVERAHILGAVRAIELPFSASYDAGTTAILDRIESLVTNMGLEWMGAEHEDALTLRRGYTNALTNCGDPHAMIGNEGWYGSVDAMIRTNCDTTISHCDGWINPYITQHDNSILLNFDERRSAALSSTLLREHGDGGVPISSSASMRKAVLSNRNMYGEQPSANTSIHGDSKSVVRDKKAELSERSRADTKEENPYIQIMQSMVNTWESNATPTGWKEFKASVNGPDGIEKIEQARAALFEIKTSSSRFQRLFDALEKIESRINERLGNRPRQGPAL